MPITSVTSESLQLKLRQLLPSQQGFGTDLSASDTIIPIIDLTAAAEGSDTPQYLQTALNFGGATAFDGSGDVATSPGFYRIVGTATIDTGTTSEKTATITITDGATTKKIWGLATTAAGPSNVNGRAYSQDFDLTVFLVAGETLAVANDSLCRIFGSARQVADVNGTLVQPTGFSPS
jgi:hypothetical protein